MKRKQDINIFKLKHTYINDDDAIFIKSELPEMELVKLIKVLQRKACDIEETFALSPSEMMDLLLQYKHIRAFPNDEDIQEFESKGKESFDFIEIDLYEVWEAANVVINDSDLKDKKYENENAIKMIRDYIKEELLSR